MNAAASKTEGAVNYNKYRESRVDYSGRIGPLLPLFKDKDPEWPMYSYERPAWLYWNGVANFLRVRGLSDAQIKERLANKDMRWMLDSREFAIEAMGFEHARAYFGSAPPSPPKEQQP